MASASSKRAASSLRDRLDPFQLGRMIDRKLQRIYALAHRRLSPKAPGQPDPLDTYYGGLVLAAPTHSAAILGDSCRTTRSNAKRCRRG